MCLLTLRWILASILIPLHAPHLKPTPMFNSAPQTPPFWTPPLSALGVPCRSELLLTVMSKCFRNLTHGCNNKCIEKYVACGWQEIDWMGCVLHMGEVDSVHVRLKGVHDPQILLWFCGISVTKQISELNSSSINMFLYWCTTRLPLGHRIQ